MGGRPLPATGQAAVEDELLAQLGLPSSASPEDVDKLHEAVSEYLAAAPSGIRGWAHAQVAALDAAYLQLTDPVGLEGSALRSPASPPVVVPGGPATPPARRDSTPAAAPIAAAEAEDDDDDDDDDEDDDALDAAGGLDADGEPDAEALAALYASVTPSAHQDMAPSQTARPTKKQRREARRQAAPVAVAAPAESAPNVWKGIAIVSVAFIVLAGGVLAMNTALKGQQAVAAGAGESAQPTQQAPAVDLAKIQTLMQTLAAKPNDIDTLLALGDEYYFGNEFDQANGWYQKVLAIEPQNTKALNAIGAIAYNSQDAAGAEKTWKQVLGIDANNIEAHFNLGFLYLNQAPADYTGVQREWNTVIALDPNSQFAQVAKSHLDSLAAASMLPASGTAGDGSATAGDGAASPAASAAPSAAPASPAASTQP